MMMMGFAGQDGRSSWGRANPGRGPGSSPRSKRRREMFGLTWARCL